MLAGRERQQFAHQVGNPRRRVGQEHLAHRSAGLKRASPCRFVGDRGHLLPVAVNFALPHSLVDEGAKALDDLALFFGPRQRLVARDAVDEALHPHVGLGLSAPDVEDIDVVVGIYTHNTVHRVVAALGCDGVVGSAVDPEVGRLRVVELEPFTPEEVAFLWCRPLLVKRGPVARADRALDAQQSLPIILGWPQRFACIAERRQLEHVPFVAALALLIEQPARKVQLVPSSLDQNYRALEWRGHSSIDVALEVAPNVVVF